MSDRSAKIGVGYGLAAYLSWGLFPLYFKALQGASEREILAHRVVWSALLLAIVTSFHGQWPAVRTALRDRRVLLTLVASTILIAVNWLTFIETMLRAKVLQASMGYFINPLVNILLGYIFLHERLRPLQKVSVALAAVGVLCFTWMAHQIPVYPLVLAVSFALYGLLRKIVRVEAMLGLTVETLLLTPLALAYLGWLATSHQLAFVAGPWRLTILLFLAGAVTTGPLVWFTNAARRLRLSTMGFLQYLAPTLQFALAVLRYGEHFGKGHAMAFAFIWTGLAVYSWDALRSRIPIQAEPD